jgi:Arc/MetJ family transcription regulator
VIFKRVGASRPYPDHGLTPAQWAQVPPSQVRLDQLITTKSVLNLDTLLAEDSTFFGDLFPHVVRWQGELYLEDGLHRALRAALQQRPVIHARVFDPATPPAQGADAKPAAEFGSTPLPTLDDTSPIVAPIPPRARRRGRSARP